MKLDVKSLANKKVGDVELNDDVFGIEPRRDILTRVVLYQRAKARGGNHKVKERNEIRATKKKFVRQKGSGGARHGARSANIFRGGGVVHGPRVRSHAHSLPKKVRALGLKSALSAKAAAGDLIVIDKLDDKAAKTKDMQAQLTKMGLDNVLIIDREVISEGFAKSISNLPRVDALPSIGSNVYDILRRDKLVLTKSAVEALEERLA